MDKIERAVYKLIESFHMNLGRDHAPLKITLNEKTWKSLWAHLSSRARYTGASPDGIESIKFNHCCGELEINYVPDPIRVTITKQELFEAFRASQHGSGTKLIEDLWKRLEATR